jgi:FtsP/CotA-like multicopper oxidase with cupredoxin domain
MNEIDIDTGKKLNRSDHLIELDDRCKEKNNGASCSNEEVAELVKKNCEAAAIWNVDGDLPEHTDKSNAVIAADEALFLVNGVYVPTLEFKANVWTRLRILFASITDQMYIVFPEFCEAQLLAKDGVYLHDAPRPVKYAFLGLGNRADLLIKCTEPDPNKYPNPNLLDGLLYNQNDNDVSDNSVTDVVCNAADAIPHANKSDASVVRETLLAKAQGRITIPLMYMKITQGDPAPTCKLPNFTVTRPCYLANLQDATKLINEEDLTQDGNLTLTFGGGVDQTGTFSPFTINAKRYDEHALDEHPMFSEQVGSLSQFNITGVFDHAFHWHVIPFQLQTEYDEFKTMREHYNLSNFLGEPYFQPGDWHDTLQVPPNWCHSKTDEGKKDKKSDKESANHLTFVVRNNVDTFVSRQVVHCHVLDHEDWGMMTILNFTENSDGNFTFWGNKLLDPTCFQNQTSNKGATVKAKDDGTFTGLCCAGKHDRAGCGGGECIGQYYESLGYEAAVYALGGATRDLLFSTVPTKPDYYACA